MAVMESHGPYSITPSSGKDLGNDTDAGYPKLALYNLNESISSEHIVTTSTRLLINSSANIIHKSMPVIWTGIYPHMPIARPVCHTWFATVRPV